MLAQQALQDLFKLPLAERLRLAQRLIESALQETEPSAAVNETRNGEAVNGAEVSAESEPHPSAQWLLKMAGRYSSKPREGAATDETSEAQTAKIPFASLAGRYPGRAGNTAEHADEILLLEVKRRSGFTLKDELPS